MTDNLVRELYNEKTTGPKIPEVSAAYDWECPKAYKLRMRFHKAWMRGHQASMELPYGNWVEEHKWMGIFKGRHAEYVRHTHDCPDCMQGLAETIVAMREADFHEESFTLAR